MKKLSIVLLLSVSCFFGYSQKKVATVNFSLAKNIGSGNLGSSAAFLKDIFTLADDPNFNLNPILDNFYDAFFNELSKEFPFEVLTDSDVINNPGYMSYKSNNLDSLLGYSLKKEGYKTLTRPILGGWQGDKKAMLKIFDQVDGILFVYVTFEFSQFTMLGVGQAKIQANYNMVCYNKEGKKVFDIWQNAVSDKGVPVVAGFPILKLEKIQPMCDSAAAGLLDEVRGKLPKIIKKAAKKL